MEKLNEKQILTSIKLGIPFRGEGFEIIYGVNNAQYGLVLNQRNLEGKYESFPLSDSQAIKMINENI
jgi:hypothetical protein